MGQAETKTFAIDTPAKRSRLPSRKNPYWHGVSGGRGGASLGYRKGERGPGSWIAKLVIDGKRIEERLGQADDAKAALDAISYSGAVTAALAWARQRYAAIEARQPEAATAAVPTVKTAIESYIARRKLQSGYGNDARSRLTKHVLGDATFAGTKLSRLTQDTIARWREGLSDKLGPATINRLLNDVRAALNNALEKHRRELPAHVLGDVKSGTKALPNATETRRQVLSDDEVVKLVEAAFTIDAEGDFGRLVVMAAATGARFSQLAALTVADVQENQLRVMIPASRKGRSTRTKAHIAVPLGPEVLERLRPAIEGRRGAEPLLTCWTKKQTGPFTWERIGRGAWKSASATDRSWRKIVSQAQLPAGTVMYALRHSSIVRGLRNGLPIRLVAALHDTSTAMIERHYSAFIVDATEDLARRASLSFAAMSMDSAA